MRSSYDEQLQIIQETSSKSDVDNCIILRDELKQLQDVIQDISDKSKLELSFISNRKCEAKIQQADPFLKKNSRQVRVSITFQPNSNVVQYFSNLSGLGRVEHSNQMMFTVHGKSVLNATQSNDDYIIAICVLQDGYVLVATASFIKLLNQENDMVVSLCRVTTTPSDMCLVTPSEVAVTMDDFKTRDVQFITVKNRKLVTGRNLHFQHRCSGIAFHQGDLYIAAKTALYKYTMSGKLVSKMYEDTSGPMTVWKCAVSPTGDQLYITSPSKCKLLTLASDGSVLATFTDPALQDPRGVHVTRAGQVLVIGVKSDDILQVDSEGRRKLAILATAEDGVKRHQSVCYNQQTASIL